jgi:lipopolysaccharide biosynthesis glycosyltransferase
VLCVDRAFLPYAELVVGSFLRWNAPAAFHIFIPEGQLEPTCIERISNRLKAANSTLQWDVVEMAELSGVQMPVQLSPATLLRILVPELLPAEVRRFLYLDCDVVVRDRVDELMHFDLQGRSFAAALEYACATQSIINRNGMSEYFESIDLKFSAYSYFNAGVMIVDAPRWRERKLTQRVLNWLTNCQRELRHGDQDALNACLSDEWAELPPRFNWAPNAWRMFSQSGMIPEEFESRAKVIREAQKKPAIIHYVGPKPWDREYYKYTDYHIWVLAWWKEARRLRVRTVYVQSVLEIYDWIIRCFCTRNRITSWLYWGLRRRVMKLVAP